MSTLEAPEGTRGKSLGTSTVLSAI